MLIKIKKFIKKKKKKKKKNSKVEYDWNEKNVLFLVGIIRIHS